MNTLLTVALTSQIVPDMPALSTKEWRALSAAIGNEDDVGTISSVSSTFGSEVEGAVKKRLEYLADFESKLEVMASIGICVVSLEDERFPKLWLDRLGERTPPLVFCLGNLDILNHGSVGVVGSRNVDDGGAAFADEVAREVANHGMALVSGGAKGVDLRAMGSALSHGGTVLGLLADSLARSSRSADVADMIESGRLCLCTPYSPDAPFNVGNAMGRNKLIYGHALATVVVSSDLETGGTWAGAVEAMRLGLGSVIVRNGEEVPPGNEALIRKGGIPIESPGELWNAIRTPAAIQESLF